jgi:hypothetical protein
MSTSISLARTTGRSSLHKRHRRTECDGYQTAPTPGVPRLPDCTVARRSTATPERL